MGHTEKHSHTRVFRQDTSPRQRKRSRMRIGFEPHPQELGQARLPAPECLCPRCSTSSASHFPPIVSSLSKLRLCLAASRKSLTCTAATWNGISLPVKFHHDEEGKTSLYDFQDGSLRERLPQENMMEPEASSPQSTHSKHHSWRPPHSAIQQHSSTENRPDTDLQSSSKKPSESEHRDPKHIRSRRKNATRNANDEKRARR